eukprot:gene33961-41097_t
MLALEDLPCALYFSICDIWLTDSDLIHLDAALTSLDRRGKYLSILSYSKVLTHHSVVATHPSLAWMSKRSLSCSELIVTIRDLLLITSEHCPFPIATQHTTSLHIMCTDSPTGQSLKSLGEALKEFPKLTKLSIRGHYFPCSNNVYIERFHNDLLGLCMYCPLLRSLKILHNELLTDDMVSLVCCHLPKLRKLYLSACPLLTCRVLSVIAEADAGMPALLPKGKCRVTDFTWQSIEPIRKGSGVSVLGGVGGYAGGKGGSSLTHLSLLGPGFTRDMIVGLVHCSPHLHAFTCTYSDVLTELDIENIIARYARQLTSLSLMKANAISDRVFRVLNTHADPHLLRGLRLHSELGPAAGGGALGVGAVTTIMPLIQHMALEPPTPSTTAASTPASSAPSTPTTSPSSTPATPTPTSPSMLIPHFLPLTLSPAAANQPPPLALAPMTPTDAANVGTPIDVPMDPSTPTPPSTPPTDAQPSIATLEMFLSKFGSSLSTLQLSGSYVTDEVTQVISRHCSDMQNLYLYGNDALTDASLNYLIEAYGVENRTKACVYISKTPHMSDNAVQHMDSTLGEKLIWV